MIEVVAYLLSCENSPSAGRREVARHHLSSVVLDIESAVNQALVPWVSGIVSHITGNVELSLTFCSLITFLIIVDTAADKSTPFSTVWNSSSPNIPSICGKQLHIAPAFSIICFPTFPMAPRTIPHRSTFFVMILMPQGRFTHFSRVPAVRLDRSLSSNEASFPQPEGLPGTHVQPSHILPGFLIVGHGYLYFVLVLQLTY